MTSCTLFWNELFKHKITNMNYFQGAPLFQLYGEQDSWPLAEMLHCETIASRSRLHDWHIRPHHHAGLYQILYLHKGRAAVSLDGVRHVLQGPAALEIPQAFVHGFEFEACCTGHVITITHALLTRLVQQLGPTATPPSEPVIHRFSPQDHDRSLQEACTQLHLQYGAHQPFRDARIQAWLTLLYARLRSSPAEGTLQRQTQRGLQHYVRFVNLLEQAHCQHHMVAWYARQLGLSTTHLTLLTRAHADKTPLQMIHARLALEASRSLVYTTLSISEIADTLGFSEPAHFTRFFRKTAGVSPRNFRLNILQ